MRREPSKKHAFLCFIEATTVRVIFDPRVEGVRVPETFKGQTNLGLDYALDFPIPIADLSADDFGITATLSFDRVPFATFVPWKAVFMVAAEGYGGLFWESTCPRECLVQGEEEGTVGVKLQEAVGAEPVIPAGRVRPSWLKVVE